MKNIFVNDLTPEMLETTIDIREIEEYKMGHIPGVKNIPMGNFLLNHEQFLEKDKTYYIMCQMGKRSSTAIMELAPKGYNLVNVAGGYSTYKASANKH